ncbi:general secretion pathway protein F [Halospina denitrificans]|uniref:General secretion pathway protein F n=1 Tax=Halospina denitrificans TaxID=332522 RepID=A0A4R7JTM1_9GAMM|nr:type II secretion system inner membrane protein GspF [Halospina denitrificans]TDT41375.1 general secretion pathway protein F [Halospina denitrificans]
MAAFEFKALDQRGKQKKGVLEADSARAIRQQLREKGWMPLEVSPTQDRHRKPSGFQFGKGLSTSDLALVTRQLATLIQSGIPVEQALSAIAGQSEHPRTKSMMLAVRGKVLEGYTLAGSLGEFPNAFPHLYRATVAAGEHAGHMDLVLNRLADYTESRQEARQKIQLAAIYPVILTFVAIAIVVFLLTYVVPDIIDVFVRSGQELPTLTKGLLAISNFFVDWGWLMLLLLVAAGIAFRFALQKEQFRLRFHRQLLHIPFISKLSRGLNTARFASTVSILTSSGVPLVEAMRISGEVLSNEYLKLRVREATQAVSEGGSLKNALEKTGYFPPMMIHMIGSGEVSGELDRMLERTAAHQENDLQGKITALVGLFEPLMLLVMGAVVLIIVMAIMLPIMNMSQIMG